MGYYARPAKIRREIAELPTHHHGIKAPPPRWTQTALRYILRDIAIPISSNLSSPIREDVMNIAITKPKLGKEGVFWPRSITC